MPDLKQSLQSHDLGHLKIIAEHWGVELDAPDAKTALPILVENLLNEGLFAEVIDALPDEANIALQAMRTNAGRLPWVQFTRRFGEVREMGTGRRDRERPDRNPASPAEILWYRGLAARAFFDTARGTEEFAYIPVDLLQLLPLPPENQAPSQIEITSQPLGRPAAAVERAYTIPATDCILDHACTLLAARRVGLSPPSIDPYNPNFIHQLLIVTKKL